MAACPGTHGIGKQVGGFQAPIVRDALHLEYLPVRQVSRQAATMIGQAGYKAMILGQTFHLQLPGPAAGCAAVQKRNAFSIGGLDSCT